MRCSAAIAIKIDLFALRHAPLHLLQLAFEPGTALDQGELRLAQPVAAASIGNMADDEIVESARPCAVWITVDKLLAAARDGRARPPVLRACSLALASTKMIFSHAHGRTHFGHLLAPLPIGIFRYRR